MHVRQTRDKIMKAWIGRVVGRVTGRNRHSISTDLILIKESPLFDREWYASNYQDVGSDSIDAAEHYFLHGWKEGRNPSRHFDSNWYLSTYPDVAEAGINPLVHFLQSGHNEARLPLPPAELLSTNPRDVYNNLNIDFSSVEAAESQTDLNLVKASGLFDAKWYLATYADVSVAGADALEHFLSTGGAEGRNPSPTFDTDWYKDTYPEVVESGLNPLIHYLRHGRNAGFAPLPPSAVPKQKSARTASTKNAKKLTPTERLQEDIRLVEESALFNAKWYLATYPSIAKSGADPTHHYVRFGGFQGRNPSIHFDSEYYLQKMPELRRSGINPLVHYLREGRDAGLKPMALFDYKRDPTALFWGSAVKYPSESDWLPSQTSLTLALGSHKLGWLACNKRDRVRIDESLLPYLNPIEAFLALSGDSGRTKAQYTTGSRQKPTPAPTASVHAAKGLNFSSLTGISAHDAWLPSDFDLRVRLEIAKIPDKEQAPSYIYIRFFQYDPDSGNICQIGKSPLLTEGEVVLDASLRDPYLPVLIVVNANDGNLYDTALLPFPALCRGGCYYGELGFYGFAPNAFDRLKSYGDRIMHEWFAGKDAAPARLRSVTIDSRHALGSERIFQASYLAWLSRIMGIRPQLDDSDQSGRDDVVAYLRTVLEEGSTETKENLRADATIDLTIPPYALPSLRTLVSRTLSLAETTSSVVGSFVVCDEISGEPQTAIVMPQVQYNLNSLLSREAVGFYPIYSRARDAASEQQVISGPAALIFRPNEAIKNNVTAITRHRFDETTLFAQRLTLEEIRNIRVKVIASYRAESDLSVFARSLKEQSLGACINDVQFIYNGTEKSKSNLVKGLDILFPNRKGVVAVQESQANKVEDYVLFCDASILLPDRRSLECLVHMARMDKIASAGCVTMHTTVIEKKVGRALKNVEVTNFSSGGYFPSHFGLEGSPFIAFRKADSLRSLPDMTYPVVANSFHMTLFRSHVLLELGIDPDACNAATIGKDLELGLRAIQAGYQNLCTSVVRGITHAEFKTPELVDPIAEDFFSQASWQQVLASCTTLRAVS